jgi:hypothetical protein
MLYLLKSLLLPFISCIMLEINNMLIWLNIWHCKRISKVTIGSSAIMTLISGIEPFQQSVIMIHSILWKRKGLRQR